MQPDITIQPIGNAWSPQVVGLILPIQQLEFHVPTTLEKQPDLLDIEASYHATGGGFWGALATGHAKDTGTAGPDPATDRLTRTAGHDPATDRLIGTAGPDPATGRLIGTIGLIAIAAREPGNTARQPVFGVIRKMFVHKDYRGKPHNIAQRLLDALFAHARTTGIQDLYLGTIHTMEAAARFYTRNAFLPIDRSALPALFPLMSVDDSFYHLTVA